MASQLGLPSSYNSLSYQQIIVSHHPTSAPSPTPIVIVKLNRPGKHNAFTAVMATELEQIFELLGRDDRVKCIVLTATGMIFCAGADLEIGFSGNTGEKNAADHRDSGGRVALAIHRCRKATIAALNGSAVGVGITMTLPCTIRLAPSNAKIGFVFTRRGLVMEACSSFFLPKLIGMSRALHICTTGSVYPSSDPLLSGLFSEILPDAESVLSRGLELAEEIAANTSPISNAVMRDLMYRAEGSAEEQHLVDSRILFDRFRSEDSKEGVQSFLEKRNAVFKGSVYGDDRPQYWPWWNDIDISRPKESLSEGVQDGQNAVTKAKM